MPIHSNLRPGDTFGRYRLEKFLGAGGFAVVWKAYDTLTQTTVALKIFSTLDDKSIQDLANEYGQVHNLSHPNIVRAEHFDSLNNVPYLVMKFCSGSNLERVERMAETEVLAMVRQIAEALVYVHSQELVHQDIKPANILTEPTNSGVRYLLSDFGISAKSRTRLSKSVKEGAESGSYLTYAYAPPEKFSAVKADRMPDRKGDIFSLGITAYELATGHLPFDDLDTGRELHYNPATYVDVSEIHNPTLRNVISACLLADKSSRPEASNLINWIDYGNSHSNATNRRTYNKGNTPRKDSNPLPASSPINPSGQRKPELIRNSTPYVSQNERKKSNSGWWIFVLVGVIITFLIVFLILDRTSNKRSSDSSEEEYVIESPVSVSNPSVQTDYTTIDTLPEPVEAYIEKAPEEETYSYDSPTTSEYESYQEVNEEQ